MAFDPDSILDLLSEGVMHFTDLHQEIIDVSAWLTEHATMAVNEFSLEFPAELFEAVVLTDAYTAPVPSGWVQGFSRICSIEHPIGNRPRTFVHQDLYQPYPTTGADIIEFTSTMTSGATVNIVYTGIHTWVSNPCTLSDVYVPVVRLLAASKAAQAIAAFYNDIPPIPMTNNVNRGDLPSTQWRETADKLMADYKSRLDQIYIKVNDMQVVWG